MMSDTNIDATLTPIGYKPRFVPRQQAERSVSDQPAFVSEPTTSANQLISFIIPVKDEAETIVELCDRIIAAAPEDSDIEILFIDDGSKDTSWTVIEDLAKRDPSRVRGLRFRHNSGKAAALTAGFRAARGTIVFTLDADLQDDPVEIPRMLQKLNEGYDIVSGWKRVRNDPWHKVIPSRIFNWMLSRVSGVHLHDHNCGFKCYRSEVTRELTLHGELHRMVPSLAAIKGFRSTEVPVVHHPRRHGVSKYGFERYLRGFMDMLLLGFMKRFRERPSHCMGFLALFCLFGGLAFLLAGVVGGAPAAVGQALVIIGATFAAASVPTIACGLVAELVMRGGLATIWRLPVSHDTAFSRSSASQGDRSVSGDSISDDSFLARADPLNPHGFCRISKRYLRHK